MHFLTRLALCTLAVAGMATPAVAQEPSIFELREPVRALAFDPARFFTTSEGRDRSSVRILYTGDDYGWPVYTISIAAGCRGDEELSPEACATRLAARMVRAPAPPGMDRPRQRGTYLLGQLAQRGATTPPRIATALSEVGTEWLEADLRTCEGALAVLRRADEADWTPNSFINLDRPPTAVEYLAGLTMHADMVQVEFQQNFRRSTYRGEVAEGTPAGWADALATAIEPCWRPASAPPPWATAPRG